MPDCTTNCPHADKIAFIEKVMEKSDIKNSEQHKEFYEAITDIKLTQKETQSDVKIVRSEISAVLELVKTVQADTAELKNKPSKKIDAISVSVIAGSIMVISTAVITAILKLL